MADDATSCGSCKHWRPFRRLGVRVVSGHCTDRSWLDILGPIPAAFDYPTPRKTFWKDGAGCRCFQLLSTDRGERDDDE